MDTARYRTLYLAPIPVAPRARALPEALPAFDERHFYLREGDVEVVPLSLPQLFVAGVECGHTAARGELKHQIGTVFSQLEQLREHFREVQDRAKDDRARYRRHSLMAEANRAYAERDEDRLRLILHAWERSPESVLGDGEAAESLRVRRRIAQLDEQLIAMDAELADVKSSAIARLQRKIDEARAQGWDLFAEMIQQVRREIARAQGRLASLGRSKVRNLAR